MSSVCGNAGSNPVWGSIQCGRKTEERGVKLLLVEFTTPTTQQVAGDCRVFKPAHLFTIFTRSIIMLFEGATIVASSLSFPAWAI